MNLRDIWAEWEAEERSRDAAIRTIGGLAGKWYLVGEHPYDERFGVKVYGGPFETVQQANFAIPAVSRGCPMGVALTPHRLGQ